MTMHILVNHISIRYDYFRDETCSASDVPDPLERQAKGTEDLVKKLLPIELTDQQCDKVTEAAQLWLAAARQEETPAESNQKLWDCPLAESVVEQIKLDASPMSLAAFNAAATKSADCSVNAIPISTVGLMLTDEEVRTAVCLRYVLPVFAPHPCRCGEVTDCFGAHCFSCRRNNGKSIRHSMMNAIIKQELSKCHIPAVLEPGGLIAGSPLRPDGVTTIPWERGMCLAWDFTCTHTLTPSNLRVTHGETGRAAANSEAKKAVKYPTGKDHVGPTWARPRKSHVGLSIRNSRGSHVG